MSQSNLRCGIKPEDGLVMLIEEVLQFAYPAEYEYARYNGIVELTFRHQPEPVKVAVRKHWLVDHLPTYAVMLDLSLSDFEAQLADQFWTDIQVAADNAPARRRRRWRKKPAEEAIA